MRLQVHGFHSTRPARSNGRIVHHERSSVNRSSAQPGRSNGAVHRAIGPSDHRTIGPSSLSRSLGRSSSKSRSPPTRQARWSSSVATGALRQEPVSPAGMLRGAAVGNSLAARRRRIRLLVVEKARLCRAPSTSGVCATARLLLGGNSNGKRERIIVEPRKRHRGELCMRFRLRRLACFAHVYLHQLILDHIERGNYFFQLTQDDRIHARISLVGDLNKQIGNPGRSH